MCVKPKRECLAELAGRCDARRQPPEVTPTVACHMSVIVSLSLARVVTGTYQNSTPLESLQHEAVRNNGCARHLDFSGPQAALLFVDTSACAHVFYVYDWSDR